MARGLFSEIHHPIRKHHRFILALSWCTGLICGIFLFLYTGRPLASMMRSTTQCPASIVSLFFTAILPFLISVFAVYICRAHFLLPICFIKALFYSFVSMGVTTAFGNAGWLICTFVMGSDSLCIVLLYVFWLRRLSGRTLCSLAEAVAMFSLSILVGSVNYCIISPFLAMLIENLKG